MRTSTPWAWSPLSAADSWEVLPKPRSSERSTTGLRLRMMARSMRVSSFTCLLQPARPGTHASEQSSATNPNPVRRGFRTRSAGLEREGCTSTACLTGKPPAPARILYKKTDPLYKVPMRSHQREDAQGNLYRMGQWVTRLEVGGAARALPDGLAEILSLCPNVSRHMVRDGR